MMMLQINNSKSFKTQFGPFNSFIQKRWKKPADTAQTRLENRTRDLKLDKLATDLKKLKIIHRIYELMMRRKRGPFVSVQIISWWKNIVGLNINMGEFLNKYPHVFEVFTHPVRRNLCCRVTRKMRDLINEEDNVTKECELESVRRVKKLLMISKSGILHVHALRLIRRELGLPADFRDSILAKYKDHFRLVDLENVELVSPDDDLGVAKIENWREREYREKWLSEFEIKFAFPISFPTGFKIERGERVKMKNWQRLPYLKPYGTKEFVKMRTSGGVERYEKRVVAIIHEMLSLTVEGMIEVERLAHFRKDLGMEVNVRELLLKHPGIFYISTRGSTHIVFLRELYAKGSMINPNPISAVRGRMLNLVLMGCRNTRELPSQEEVTPGDSSLVPLTNIGAKAGSHWVLPILESLNTGNDNFVMLHLRNS
ncbi:protein ROOT PRIMORDIUM DEFECTIVE 1 [Mercurialis annua]|uniref:protein ROOT PRIMORDIUM DEFECTIVE 1 n=1 Tax=Mercurialis annua TaxID=3986 RepID=UPI0021608E4A|nr:protein ROOT PRIMORDIUM DEFECTIVE 1 [Mercurialis annua]XP_050234539.1 protein ROOT PRIMORDIUM DEFECTIVE 1 [Mercurialis annua]XP_050234540.1 protein ROOT PRIMORDIUM DEFECTIVE 1 [Mercurialis annua]